VLQSLGRLMGLGLSFLERSTASVQTSSAEQEPYPEPMMMTDSVVGVIENSSLRFEEAADESVFELDVVTQAALIDRRSFVFGHQPLEEPLLTHAGFEHVVKSEESELPQGVSSLDSESKVSSPLDLEPNLLGKHSPEIVVAEQSCSQHDIDDSKSSPPYVDDSEIPFTMGDLLSSFENNQDKVSQDSQDYSGVNCLGDDPNMWPSIAKNS
jgi:hypothetical protein